MISINVNLLCLSLCLCLCLRLYLCLYLWLCLCQQFREPLERSCGQKGFFRPRNPIDGSDWRRRNSRPVG